MGDDVSLALCDGVVCRGNVEGFVQEVFTYRRIELHNVKADETMLFFVFDGVEPVNHCWCVLPLVDLRRCNDFGVDPVKNLLTDFP